MISGMFRVKDGRLVPIEPTSEEESYQRGWENRLAIESLTDASERLEMAERDDLAREARDIRSRFMASMK